MARSVTEVKQIFEEYGVSIQDWALSHGYSPALVYRVLSGGRLPVRGQSHAIAVALGLKDGCSDLKAEHIDQLLKEERAMSAKKPNPE